MKSNKNIYTTLASILNNCNVDPVTGCWTWKGAQACVKRGGGVPRGVVNFNNKRCYVYRLVFEMKTGETIAPRALIRHTCDNPICCNPAHLLSGTDRDNALDAARRGRLNHTIADEQVQEILDMAEKMPGARYIDIKRALADKSIKYWTVKNVLARGDHVERVEYRKTLRELELDRLVERPSYGVVEFRQRVEPGMRPVVATEVMRARRIVPSSMPPVCAAMAM